MTGTRTSMTSKSDDTTMCGECGGSIDRRKEYVQVRATFWLNNRGKVLGVINMHKDCFKKVGLAGRWKELRKVRSA